MLTKNYHGNVLRLRVLAKCVWVVSSNRVCLVVVLNKSTIFSQFTVWEIRLSDK